MRVWTAEVGGRSGPMRADLRAATTGRRNAPPASHGPAAARIRRRARASCQRRTPGFPHAPLARALRQARGEGKVTARVRQRVEDERIGGDSRAGRRPGGAKRRSARAEPPRAGKRQIGEHERQPDPHALDPHGGIRGRPAPSGDRQPARGLAVDASKTPPPQRRAEAEHLADQVAAQVAMNVGQHEQKGAQRQPTGPDRTRFERARPRDGSPGTSQQAERHGETNIQWAAVIAAPVLRTWRPARQAARCGRDGSIARKPGSSRPRARHRRAGRRSPCALRAKSTG